MPTGTYKSYAPFLNFHICRKTPKIDIATVFRLFDKLNFGISFSDSKKRTEVDVSSFPTTYRTPKSDKRLIFNELTKQHRECRKFWTTIITPHIGSYT